MPGFTLSVYSINSPVIGVEAIFANSCWVSSICVAVGKAGVDDSDELHGIVMKVTIKVEDATPNYPASNAFTGFHLASTPDGASAVTAGGGAGKEALPWETEEEEHSVEEPAK